MIHPKPVTIVRNHIEEEESIHVLACAAASSGTMDQFYPRGCSTCVIARANKHNMGIAILNSFLIILAVLVIPVLFNLTSRYDSTEDIDAVLDKGRHQPTGQPEPKPSPAPSVVLNRF